MAMAEGDLIQDLAVFAVSVDGDRLIVSLYGGRSNVCGTVTYTIGPSRERRAALVQLRRWARTGQPVALLCRGEELALISERAVIERALDTR